MSSQELVHRASPLTCTRESLQPLAVSQGKELWIGSRPILSPRPSPPPQSTRSHRACPEPSCHLAFSASSAIQHLLFTTRKIISQGSGLKKKKKPHSIPGLGHRSHFPSSLGLSLYPVPALHPQILSPLPPFQDKSSGSLSPLGGYSGGQGGGEVAVTVKVRIHVTLPATPAGYDSSPKCQ